MSTFIPKGFSHQTPPYKLVDSYLIKNKAIYKVTLSHIRLANNQLLANVEECYEDTTLVNDHFVSMNDGKKSGSKSIFKAFDNAEEFLKAFNIIADKSTDIQFTVNVEELPDNAPITLKAFFQNKLSAEHLERLMKAVELEISNRKKSVKVEGGLKKSLTQDILKFIDNQAINHKFKIVCGAIIVAILIAAVIATAVGLNISPLFIQAAVVMDIIVTPLIAIKIMSKYLKQKATALIKLGEFENDNIDTPENKKNLVTKLTSVLDPKDEKIKPNRLISDNTNKINPQETDSSAAIDIGQKSYHSYLAQFTSIFKSAAYHPGYYVGQEMEAKLSLMNIR